MSKTVLTYSYSQAKNGYIVSGYDSIADNGEVIIPERDNGKEGNLKVFGIGNGAFKNCDKITSIVIPNFITEIGEDAFNGCKNLVKVVINCNITALRAGIFSGCTSLSAIDIPNSVIQIEEKAFQNCSAIKSIIIPNSVINIGKSAFYGCKSLASVVISDNVESVGEEAFSGCTNITYASIPTTVISAIPKFSLQTVIITSGTSIGIEAFKECYNLISVTIGNSVESIGIRAFYFCWSLNSIIIGNNVTRIDPGAFGHCESLTSVTIPPSVKSINNSAFSNCTSLTAVYITDLAAWCGIWFGGYDSNPLHCAHSLYLDGILVTNLVIPDSVTSISNYAFSYYTGLTSVTIPDGVTNIGGGAFCNCTNLTKVVIPDSVISIGSGAFQGCTGLTSIIIPDGVESIDSFAFSGCTGLTSIVIPDSVTHINWHVFEGCDILTIYCEVTSQPDEWDIDWNSFGCLVQWGHTDQGVVNDNVIWIEGESIEGEKVIVIIGYQGQPRAITLPEKINGQLVKGVKGFAKCKAELVNIHCDVAKINSNAFQDSENITFRYFAPINRITDNYPYGATRSTRVYAGMPYQDMDFLGFTFNGKHSYLDLGVLRIISDRIQHSLSPDMNNITADNPGGEGMYYFGSRHKSRKFSIDFAFDHLTEQQMREWKRFCSNKELSDLIFDEEPYKVYTAKITGAPILKTIPFNENGQRIYKGEGTLEFTCYWPYAHTPDENTKVSEKFIVGGKFGADGKIITNYVDFLHINKPLWEEASGITNISIKKDEAEYDYVYNAGDIDAPFVAILSLEEHIAEKDYSVTIGPLTIIPRETVKGLQWDSKTGIVSGIPIGETTRRAILYDGDGLGGLIPGVNRIPKNIDIKYHYWYY